MFIKHRQFGSAALFSIRQLNSLVIDCDSVRFSDGWTLHELGAPMPLAWFATLDEANAALDRVAAALEHGDNFFDLAACETELEPCAG